ncbi:thioredoxin family protein [Cognatishimia sp.]|uniref:thioredoxin family protein n=1 Tax=Cognatishimia sp. TaxID=2211648 RepID=UPI003518765E
MNRRDFMLLTAAVSTVPAMGFAAPEYYTKGLIDEHLAAGRTVYVDFQTNWCSTCRAMARRLTDLRSKNPAYDENIVFVIVDFDRWGGSSLTKKWDVRSRSTHVVLKGDQELGRVYAKSSVRALGGLLDIALEAATASS